MSDPAAAHPSSFSFISFFLFTGLFYSRISLLFSFGSCTPICTPCFFFLRSTERSPEGIMLILASVSLQMVSVLTLVPFFFPLG